MAAICTIREEENELVITSVRSRRGRMAIVWIVISVTFFWFAHRRNPGLVWVAFGVYAVGWQIVEMFRGTTVQLKVTNFEFTANGYFGGGYHPDRIIPRADVIRMEYRKEQNGEEGYYPSGLYLECKWKTSCVLPGLDEIQTNEIIDAIYRRYPDMPLTTDEGPFSLFKDDIIRLSLSYPRK